MQVARSSSKGRLKRIAIFILKVAISAFAFWYVSSKIDFARSLQLLTKADPVYLLLALLVFNISKIISTFRILVLLKSIGFRNSRFFPCSTEW